MTTDWYFSKVGLKSTDLVKPKIKYNIEMKWNNDDANNTVHSFFSSRNIELKNTEDDISLIESIRTTNNNNGEIYNIFIAQRNLPILANQRAMFRISLVYESILGSATSKWSKWYPMSKKGSITSFCPPQSPTVLFPQLFTNLTKTTENRKKCRVGNIEHSDVRMLQRALLGCKENMKEANQLVAKLNDKKGKGDYNNSDYERERLLNVSQNVQCCLQVLSNLASATKNELTTLKKTQGDMMEKNTSVAFKAEELSARVGMMKHTLMGKQLEIENEMREYSKLISKQKQLTEQRRNEMNKLEVIKEKIDQEIPLIEREKNELKTISETCSELFLQCDKNMEIIELKWDDFESNWRKWDAKDITTWMKYKLTLDSQQLYDYMHKTLFDIKYGVSTNTDEIILDDNKNDHEETDSLISTFKSMSHHNEKGNCNDSTNFIDFDKIYNNLCQLRISGKSLRWIDKSDLKDIGFDSKHLQDKVYHMIHNDLIDCQVNEKEKEKVLPCRLCYERIIQTVIIPCGHACMCNQCGEKWKQKCAKKCPMCRAVAQSLVKLYF